MTCVSLYVSAGTRDNKDADEILASVNRAITKANALTDH
jgi:hypothetical protein